MKRIPGEDGLEVWIERPDARFLVGDVVLYEEMAGVFRRPAMCPHRVEVRVQLDERQQPVVGVVAVQREPGGDSVRGADLRKIPVERLAREVLDTVSFEVTSRKGSTITARPAKGKKAGRSMGPGPWKLDDAFMRELAEVYMAHEAGGAPVRAVVQHFTQKRQAESPRAGEVPRATASRWIQLAKDRGYLPRKSEGRNQ